MDKYTSKNHEGLGAKQREVKSHLPESSSLAIKPDDIWGASHEMAALHGQSYVEELLSDVKHLCTLIEQKQHLQVDKILESWQIGTDSKRMKLAQEIETSAQQRANMANRARPTWQ